MIDGVTLVINGQDFSPDLSTYSCDEEFDQEDVIETMDHKRHAIGETVRDVLRFKLIPERDDYGANYRALSARPLHVLYSKPHFGTLEADFLMDTDTIERAFLLKNYAEDVYYNGSVIQLVREDAREVM